LAGGIELRSLLLLLCIVGGGDGRVIDHADDGHRHSHSLCVKVDEHEEAEDCQSESN